ncbi:hypothetical protein CMUS01_00984 [Colletotrichum musicola]|uniref:Uncharacterized protein n=1 Tax=Colletotrichum musicola TaxID=2175873 RepID=A0A8H6U8Z0_9PEZI|nr:hypothetical protein CMUS01_00984 [Colletotrichum musicola]
MADITAGTVRESFGLAAVALQEIDPLLEDMRKVLVTLEILTDVKREVDYARRLIRMIRRLLDEEIGNEKLRQRVEDHAQRSLRKFNKTCAAFRLEVHKLPKAEHFRPGPSGRPGFRDRIRLAWSNRRFKVFFRNLDDTVLLLTETLVRLKHPDLCERHLKEKLAEYLRQEPDSPLDDMDHYQAAFPAEGSN